MNLTKFSLLNIKSNWKKTSLKGFNPSVSPSSDYYQFKLALLASKLSK